MIVTLVSESINSSILFDDRPVLQQISSNVLRPLYNFCRPFGIDPVKIGYLFMQRIKLCLSPNFTSFRSSILCCRGDNRIQSVLRLTPCVICEYN